jgi:hypothetical protein
VAAAVQERSDAIEVANPSTFVSGLQVSLVMAAVLLLGTAVASLQVRPAPSR